MIPFTEIKLIILAIMIASILGYGYHLKSVIKSDEIQILTLTNSITKQNDAIKSASDASYELQNRINTVSVSQNKPIIITATKIKTIIENRPISTTCEDDVIKLESTAKDIATDWNTR